MGQMKSKNGGMLSISYDSYYADETFTKMENLLKELTEKPEERDILNRWEHTMNKRFRCSLERWRAFGWAIRVLENWGKHRIVLAFALRQVELAHELEDTNEFPQGVDVNAAILLADSYLNLAKVNLIKSQYKSCEKYSSKCLSLVSTIRRVYTDGLKLSGHAYLYKANANLGLSNFKQTLEDLERSLSVANDQDDKQLECLACGTMSSLYIQLKDYEKGNFFAVKSCEILTQHGSTWLVRTKSITQLNLAEAYRKVGKIEEAMVVAEEALKAAISNGDRCSQAYAMLCFADIHRVRKDEARSLPRYNSAAGLMLECGNQFGYMMSVIGKAKVYHQTKDYQKALQEYLSGYKIAELIGNKMTCMRIHGELALLFQRLSNQEEARSSTLRYHRLLELMDLFCGICGEPMAEKNEQLEALPCSHFFHLKCISSYDTLETRMCPDCHKKSLKQVTL